MSKIDEMTTEDFNQILIEILQEMKASQLIDIPGIYEIVAEEFNNEVIDKWIEKVCLKQEGRVNNDQM